MNNPQKLTAGGECFICGNDVVITTTAPQECQVEHDNPCSDECKKDWWAYDGDPNSGGCLANGMRAINAIEAVIAARPGLLTPLDLPLVPGVGTLR